MLAIKVNLTCLEIIHVVELVLWCRFKENSKHTRPGYSLSYTAKKVLICHGDGLGDRSANTREFKALSATNPAAGGYLIPEIYLDQIIELLYSKTVIFELGAQKVPMANGNLNIPKMTGGARATWGGEARHTVR